MKKMILLILVALLMTGLMNFTSLKSNAQATIPPGVPRNATICGETIYALSSNNTLLSFNSDVPGTILSSASISGLQAGESLLGIDYRPAIREIWGITNQNRLYVIDSSSGLARLTATLNTTVNGTAFGVDFNPVPDRMRVTSDADQNLRINVETGATTIDGTLSFNTGDTNAAANPNIVASAYTNNFAGATTTTLYGIDSNLDILAIQNPPNDGRLTTVGALGVDTTDQVGFDIAANSFRAFASLTPTGSSASNLYSINLATGAATLVGAIGSGQIIRDITVSPRRATPVTVYAITSNNRLITFDLSDPGTITSFTRIRGLQRGESILAIDFRPANGRLYALGSSGTIYTIRINNGGAVPRPTAPFSAALNGQQFGFDFNPTVDRIRLVSDATQNLRLNPDSGEVAATDGAIAYASGGATPRLVGSAYTNNFAGATTTTLYGIDSTADALVIQNPPNNGTLNTVGSLGVDTGDFVGFDILACENVGYAALTPGGATSSNFYRINLATGAATLIGTINIGDTIRGIALQ
jgi:hypothetical protein